MVPNHAFRTVRAEVLVRLVLITPVIVAVLVLFAPPPPAIAQPADETCLACHTTGGLTLTLPSTEVISVTIDPQVLKNSVHGSVATCTSCHAQNSTIPHPPVTRQTFREYKVERAQACRACHSNVAEQFDRSIHGRALTMGFADVPTCTSCHGAHNVVRARTATFRNNTPQLCGSCHGDPAIMRKYGLQPVYEAYIREFHGVTTTLYKLTKPYSPTPAAICYDCHGVHDIKATDDPTAPVAPANILTTCRQCHTTAGRLFASAWTEHKTPGPTASPLVWYVQVFYRILIPSVLGFLIVLTLLDLGRWAGDRLKRGA